MDEVDVHTVDLRRELRQRVQSRLARPPVVLGRPVAGELLDRRQLHALRPIGDEFLARKACHGDAAAEIVDVRVWHVDDERADGGALGGADPGPAESEQERAAADAIATFTTTGFGYFLEQSTRPQTIGYALLDSPLALAAWLLDHDTDSYYKISRAFAGGQPSGGLTRDHILDNITLYWLTGTGASAARPYWEIGRAQALAAGQAPPPVSLPVGFTTFPGEIFRAPRRWVEKGYPNLTYFHEVDRGGHFAAWEEPELFATEIRAAFMSLR